MVGLNLAETGRAHKWRGNGDHCQQTAEAWLELRGLQRDALIPILAGVYGEEAAPPWFERRRGFFLACSNPFRYPGGNEWWLTHVRLSPRRPHANCAETPRCWREEMSQNLRKMQKPDRGERSRRMREFHLCDCEGGFEEREIGVVHAVFEKPEVRREPIFWKTLMKNWDGRVFDV